MLVTISLIWTPLLLAGSHGYTTLSVLRKAVLTSTELVTDPQKVRSSCWTSMTHMNYISGPALSVMDAYCVIGDL